MAITRTLPKFLLNRRGGLSLYIYDIKTAICLAPLPSRRGSQVIVIHPGSRFLRIGRACDVIPLSIPCVVARKCRTKIPKVTRIRNVTRPWSQMTQDEIVRQKEKTEEGKANNKDPVSHSFIL